MYFENIVTYLEGGQWVHPKKGRMLNKAEKSEAKKALQKAIKKTGNQTGAAFISDKLKLDSTPMKPLKKKQKVSMIIPWLPTYE